MGLLQLSLTQLSPSSLHCPSEISSNNSRSHWTEAVGLKNCRLEILFGGVAVGYICETVALGLIKVDCAIISN